MTNGIPLADEGLTMAELVPNPLYLALGDALRVVEPLAHEIEKGIAAPY